ncbi:hypothetical protein D3C86_1738850 [compost metagenome]
MAAGSSWAAIDSEAPRAPAPEATVAPEAPTSAALAAPAALASAPEAAPAGALAITVAVAALAVRPVVNTLGVSTGGLPPARSRSAGGGALACSSSGHLPTR